MTRFLLALLASIAAGAPTPDFRLPDQNGKVVRLTEARGHKTVLVFYRGHW